jgi:hypothetical protein
VGRKELKEFDEIAAPGVAAAIPLVDADEPVFGHGRQGKDGAEAQAQHEARGCGHNDVSQVADQRQDRLAG